MAKPNPENLPPVPKARPSAWWVSLSGYGLWCRGSGVRTDIRRGDNCDLCGRFHEQTALWGHEWALVVMRATDRDILSGSHHHTDGWSVGACSDPEGLW